VFVLTDDILRPGGPPAKSVGRTEGKSVFLGTVGVRHIDGPGDFIFKPRGQWHTFWNAGDEPARILEIISPAGFEQIFDELSDFGGVDTISTETLDELCARYELEMDVRTVPELRKRFDVKFPGQPIWTMNRRVRNPVMPTQCRRGSKLVAVDAAG